MGSQFEIASLWQPFHTARHYVYYQQSLPNSIWFVCWYHLTCFCSAVTCFLEQLAPLWRSWISKADYCGKPGHVQVACYMEVVSSGLYTLWERLQCKLKKTPDYNEGCHNSIQYSHTVAHVKRVTRHSPEKKTETRSIASRNLSSLEENNE